MKVFVTPSRLFIAICLSAACWPVMAAGVDGDSSAPFAIIPQSVAEGLKTETPRDSVIKAAQAALARKPDAIPVLHTEGTLPHQGLWDASIEARKDWDSMRDLGLAYRMTGNAEYLAKDELFFSAWLDTYKVSLNPIDETNLDTWFIAYDLVRNKLSKATQDKMNVFLRTLAEGYLDAISKQMTAGKEDQYNWQSHRIKILTLASLGLGDDALIKRAHAAYQRQLSVNLALDGEVKDFEKRDALHYVVYDLEPLTMTALAAKEHGWNWFQEKGETGGSIPTAIDWLTPFALGQKTHEEFVHSTIKFDAQRAQANVKGFSGPWEPVTSTELYTMASLFDQKYEPVLDKVRPTGSQTPEWLEILKSK
jgi:hypothetical protein